MSILLAARGNPGGFSFGKGAMTIYSKPVQIEDMREICEQFKPLVKKYAWKYSNTIQDSESEAGLALVRAIRTYDPETGVPLAGYLESQVKFGLLNLWRKEMKRRQMEYHGDKALEYVAAPNNPQAELIYKETIDRMLAALQELPQRQLLVLIHIFIYGRKLAYIAQVLGITAQAVYQLKKRALSRLKSRLI